MGGVQSEKDSYQGMPLGMPRARGLKPASAAELQDKLLAAKAAYPSPVVGIAEAMP
jgi:hypothetical protein